jgi:hypothetical protein
MYVYVYVCVCLFMFGCSLFVYLFIGLIFSYVFKIRFHDISGQIKGLDYKDSVLAGRKIHQLIQALNQVEEFQQVEQRCV